MADNGRWFKLWVTSPYDPNLGSMELEDFARWCLFGVYLKVHGNDGVVRLVYPATPLVGLLRLKSFDELIVTLRMFPNCRVTCLDNGADKGAHEGADLHVTPVTTTSVTYEIEWRNWRKYQGDFSGDRVRKHRAKTAPRVTRQEEKRREEKRGEKTTTKEKDSPGAVAPELPLTRRRLGPYQAMVASYFWTFEKEKNVKPVITPADGKNASRFCEGKDPELMAWLSWEYLTHPTDYAQANYRFSLRDIVMDSANLLGRPRRRPLPREILVLIGANNGQRMASDGKTLVGGKIAEETVHSARVEPDRQVEEPS